MISMNLFSKIKFSGLVSVATVCLGFSTAGFIQTDASPETWLSVVKWLGAGAIGILSIIAITRLVQALKNQPLDGHVVSAQLLTVTQKLNEAITLMTTSMARDHERMLKHDEDFMRRLETITSNETAALANHAKIIESQSALMRRGDENHGTVVKQLDRMENDAKEERKNNREI